MKKILFFIYILLPLAIFGQDTIRITIGDPTPACTGSKTAREVTLWDCARQRVLDFAAYQYSPSGKTTFQSIKNGLIIWDGQEGNDIFAIADDEVCYHICSRVQYRCVDGRTVWSSTPKHEDQECLFYANIPDGTELEPAAVCDAILEAKCIEDSLLIDRQAGLLIFHDSVAGTNDTVPICDIRCSPRPSILINGPPFIQDTLSLLNRYFFLHDEYNCPPDQTLVRYEGTINDENGTIYTTVNPSLVRIENDFNRYTLGLIEGRECVDSCLIESQLFEWTGFEIVSIEKIFDDGITFQFIYEFPNDAEKFRFYDFYNYAKQTGSRIVDHNGVNFHGGILESLDPISPTGVALTINTTNPVAPILDEGCEDPFNNYVSDILLMRDSLNNMPNIISGPPPVDSLAEAWGVANGITFFERTGMQDPQLVFDQIVPGIQITRGYNGPIYNEYTHDGLCGGTASNPNCLNEWFDCNTGSCGDAECCLYSDNINCEACHPYNVEFALGEISNGDYLTLTYRAFFIFVDEEGFLGNWQTLIDVPLIIKTTDIFNNVRYIDFKFKSWEAAGGGGVSWERANPPAAGQSEFPYPISFDVTNYSNKEKSACIGCYEYIISATDCDGANMAPYDSTRLSIIPIDCSKTAVCELDSIYFQPFANFIPPFSTAGVTWEVINANTVYIESADTENDNQFYSNLVSFILEPCDSEYKAIGGNAGFVFPTTSLLDAVYNPPGGGNPPRIVVTFDNNGTNVDFCCLPDGLADYQTTLNDIGATNTDFSINVFCFNINCGNQCALTQPCPEIFPLDVYSPYDESLLGTAGDIEEMVDFLNNDPLSEFNFFPLDDCTLGHGEICDVPLKSFGDIPTSPPGGSLDNQPEVCAPLFGSEQIITGSELVGLTDGSIEIKYGYSADNITWIDSPYLPWTGVETQYDFGSPVLQEGYYIRTCSRVTGDPLTEICDVKRLPELSITGSYNESNCSIQVVIENIAPDSSNESWIVDVFHYLEDGDFPVCQPPSQIIEEEGGFLSLDCLEIYAPDQHTLIYNFLECYPTIEEDGQVIFGNIYLEVEYESNDFNCYPYLYTDVIDEFRIDLPAECGTDGAPNINISGDPSGFTLTSDLSCTSDECTLWKFDTPESKSIIYVQYPKSTGTFLGCPLGVCPPCVGNITVNVCSCIFDPTYYDCDLWVGSPDPAEFLSNEAYTKLVWETWYDYAGVDYEEVLWYDVTTDPLEPKFWIAVTGTTDIDWETGSSKVLSSPVSPIVIDCQDLPSQPFAQPPAHWVIVNDGTSDVFETAQGDIVDVETELNDWWTTTAISGTTYTITIYSTFCDGTGTFVGNTIEVTAP